MNVAMWTVAGLLSLCFLASGAMKIVQPKDQVIAGGATFLRSFPAAGIRVIGLLEILGAIGLILPAVLDVATILVPVAATCLAVMIAVAVGIQLRRGEHGAAVGSLIGVAILTFVVFGSFAASSFAG